MKLATFICLVSTALVPVVCRSQSSAAAAITNAPTPQAAEQQLENAPGTVVSTPANAPADIPLTGPTAGIVKLAQAGVDESVMLNYVAAHGPFNLSSDDIVYLNDLGVSTNVVNAMMQRDQALQSENPQLASQPPAYSAPEAATAPLTPPVQEEASAPVNSSYTYFYDSLAPYGNWIDVAGYGWCWQPTVVVLNPGWRPYCNQGHWIYSNCGWYWASDYSWGWAPFHYGRWFQSARFGWCWAPDTVWGPCWVTWRYSGAYCGWAPLPPVACYAPGFGFSYYGRPVGFGFGFGIGVSWYTFVPIDRCFDRHPWHHRVPHGEVTRIYNHTRVVNDIRIDNNRIINRGIPVSHIEHATHRQIRPVAIHETADPRIGRGEQMGRYGRSLTVYRPNLPSQPRNARVAGQGVRPAPRQGNVVRGVVPPERIRHQEIRTQRTEMMRRNPPPATAPQYRQQGAQPGRQTPQAAPLAPRGRTQERQVAPGVRRPPETPTRSARPEERRQTAPPAQSVQPRTAPLTPQFGREQRQQRAAPAQPPRQQRAAPAQPQRQERVAPAQPQQQNLYRQPPNRYQAPQYQAPRYEAPRYQAPRYQAPRYEAPRYQAPRYQAPEFRPAPQQRSAPAYRAPQPSYRPAQPAPQRGGGGYYGRDNRGQGR